MGHHLWHDFISNRLSDEGRCIIARGLGEKLLQRARAHECQCESTGKNGTVPWMRNFIKELNGTIRKLRRHTNASAAFIKSCSYPCGPRVRAPGASRPDVVFLAKAAELAKADLRILILTREAVELVTDGFGNSFTMSRV